MSFWKSWAVCAAVAMWAAAAATTPVDQFVLCSWAGIALSGVLPWAR